MHKKYDETMSELAIKQTRFVNRDKRILLKDNTQAYVAQRTLLKLQERNLEVLYYPPFAPDLAPTGYYVSHALDNVLHGKIFKPEEGAKTTIWVSISSCSPEFFPIDINKLPIKWGNYLDNSGTFFG